MSQEIKFGPNKTLRYENSEMTMWRASQLLSVKITCGLDLNFYFALILLIRCMPTPARAHFRMTHCN